jgi:hypothetical protein
MQIEFSTVWKTFSRFFHAMEQYFPHCGKTWPFFPHNGKTFSDFSTQWKNFCRFFHTMEKMFPQCGKLGYRAVFGGFRAVLSGLLSGARGAPCEP